MIKRPITYLSIFLIGFLVLVFYNYRQAQIRLREARQTQFSIEFLEIPAETSTTQRAHFAWKVNAPESFSTAKTGIYWSYDSTPSALLKEDSPEVVNYANFTPDYSVGRFQLPDSFDLDLSFNQKGTVYLRAYAQIDNDHLWTEEKRVVIK